MASLKIHKHVRNQSGGCLKATDDVLQIFLTVRKRANEISSQLENARTIESTKKAGFTFCVARATWHLFFNICEVKRLKSKDERMETKKKDVNWKQKAGDELNSDLQTVWERRRNEGKN